VDIQKGIIACYVPQPECGLRSQFTCRSKDEKFQPGHVLFLDGLAFR
jgi:hypothetical protein